MSQQDTTTIDASERRIMTIERHILEQEENYPGARGVFTRMLQDLAMSAKLIAHETTRAGLTNILGTANTQNASGETQKKLDLYADEIIYEMNNFTGRICAMASEERDEIIDIPVNYSTGDYVLLVDPLDGSSNIDVNASIGTIFAIHRKFTHGERGTLDDVLQEGKRLAAAGYVIYGSSTMMVYTTGKGVHGFTLDPAIGEFLLSHPNMRFPDAQTYYSVNQGNEKFWPSGVRRYIDALQGYGEEAYNPPISARYSGALIQDFHRNLLKGGIYLYPGSAFEHDHPYGKIRLMFEAQALAFIAHQAGGATTDGIGDILEIQPHSLHQRVPIFTGQKDMVAMAQRYIEEYDQDWSTEYKRYRSGEVIDPAEAERRKQVQSGDESTEG